MPNDLPPPRPRPRRKGVTHAPYPPELRAKTVEMLRSGRQNDEVAQELGIAPHLPRGFLFEAEVRALEAEVPYIRHSHTRDEVIDRAEAEFARLDRIMAALTSEDFATPLLFAADARDRWTVKDALGHITYWKAHEGRKASGKPLPREERAAWGSDANHYVYTLWRDKPPEEVVAWHRQVHQEVVEAVNSAPDTWFANKHSWWWPANIDYHSGQHRRDIERALIAAGRSFPQYRPPMLAVIFDRLCNSFDADRAPDVDLVIQFELSGKDGGRWWARIHGGECTTGGGEVARADLTVIAKASEFVKLRLGELSPIWGAFQGKLTFKGQVPLSEALRVLSLFKTDYRLAAGI